TGAISTVPSGRKSASVCGAAASADATTSSAASSISESSSSPFAPSPAAMAIESPFGSAKEAQSASIDDWRKPSLVVMSPREIASSPSASSSETHRASTLGAPPSADATTSTGRPSSRAAARAISICIAMRSPASSSSRFPSQPSVHGTATAATARIRPIATRISRIESPRRTGWP
ncbi:MAG: hypothetical protein ACK56F_12850, partial [bacterium]